MQESRGSRKRQAKETVGAVQRQFLLDLQRAQGKVADVDALTQGENVTSL